MSMESMFTSRHDQYKYIGKNVGRKNAREFVTGKAMFLDDFTLPQMLIGRTLRSPHAHANIKSINVEAARKVKGVHAVLTYHDIDPKYRLGWPPQRGLLEERVRYVGDPVAFVAADTKTIADEAIDLIEVEYEVLSAALTGWEAVQDGAEELYPGQFKNNVVTPGFPHFQPEGLFWHLVKGDVEKGFEECDFISEDRVEYNKMPNPNAPETPGVIVRWDGDSNFTIWATSQGAYVFKLFASFGIPGCNFIVNTFNVGGSYGNKMSMTMQFVSGMALSMATKRPVKVMLTKTEQLLCYENRLGSQIQAKIGMTKDGMLRAVKGKWIVETGSFSNATQGQVSVGLGEANIVVGKCPNWDMDTNLVATNRTPAGIARGYGGMELNACLNILYCRAMEAANLDPVEVYKKNYISDGDSFVWRDGQTWKAHSVDYKQAIQVAADKFGWKEKWKGWRKPTWVSEDGRYARGVGCALIGNADAGEDNNECYVRVMPDIFGKNARVIIHMDVTESGMDQRSSLCKMVAEILNVPFESVELTQPGTGLHNPNSFALCGSRGTITYGRAVCEAAEDVKLKLFTIAEHYLKVPHGTMELVDFGVRAKHRPDRFISWKELLPQDLCCTGYGRHMETFGSPTCMVIFLEVEVDKETGLVKLIKMLSGTDVGQVINPASLEMQLQAGIGSASLDSALFEENIVDRPTGRTMTYNMINYPWRPFNQFPEHDHSILESRFDTFQFMGLGVAEIVGAATAPCCMQAISNAIGVQVSEYPATPAVILKALGKL